MRPALTPARWSVGAWIGRHPGVATGGFLSGMFVFLGLVGTLVFRAQFEDWLAAGHWPTAEAEITAGEVVYGGGRNRGARPEFTFNYVWQGRSYTARGYDLIGAYTRGTWGGPGKVLEQYPVGSKVNVLVNPARPDQAVLIRGSVGGVIVLFVPPFFLLLGLIGMFFTVITHLGWLEENTRNPLGRALRRAGGWLLQEKVLKPIFFAVVGSVIIAVGALGVKEGYFPLVLFAAVMAWGVWRAARPPRRGRRPAPAEDDD